MVRNFEKLFYYKKNRNTVTEHSLFIFIFLFFGGVVLLNKMLVEVSKP